VTAGPAPTGALSPGTPAALAVEHVTHRYGRATRSPGVVALRDVAFEVREGERFALLGPNGGGKTTLFRLVATLMRPSEGRVRVFGDDAAARPAAVRRTGS
jgi:ABC-2 type transport system ATP-binding protein